MSHSTSRRAGRFGALVPLALVLLTTTAAPAAGVEPALVAAVKIGDPTIVRIALKRGSRSAVDEPDATGMSPLHWAVARDDRQTVELLVRAGANVRSTTRYGVTPLAIACQNANAIIVTLLLRAGADPNASLPRAAPSDFTR